jgi:hypothetical protein
LKNPTTISMRAWRNKTRVWPRQITSGSSINPAKLTRNHEVVQGPMACEAICNNQNDEPQIAANDTNGNNQWRWREATFKIQISCADGHCKRRPLSGPDPRRHRRPRPT